MDSRQERRNLAQRRKLGRALGVAAVLGLVLLAAFEFWLRRTQAQAEHDPDSALRAVGAVSSLLQLAAAACAVLLGRFLLDWASQTRRQNQWPPAGLELPGNPPLRHGADALRIARRLRATGLFSLVLALAVVLAVAWRWLA